MSKPKWFWAVVWAVFGMLCLWVFLSGFVSGNVVTMVVGIVVAFVYPSLFLTSYVKSDHRVKRALEVVFMLLAFGVVIYGYVVRGSLVLHACMHACTIFVILRLENETYMKFRLTGSYAKRREMKGIN